MDTINAHPSLKFFAVASAALLATCVCFYLMLFLITRELEAPVEIDSIPNVHPSIAEHEQEKKIVATRAKPQKIMPIDPPPDPNATPINRTSWVQLDAERPTFGSIADLLGPTDIQLALEAPTSDLVPVSVVQPIYPLSAAMREQEGYVVVEFTVRENGSVLNPIVVRSEPTTLFDQAALNAVSRFRFKPREIAGESVRVDNVQLKFSFNLDSLYDIPAQN